MKNIKNLDEREYQIKYLNNIHQGNYKRAFHIWHRRAGKDLIDFNYTIYKALEDVGVYWHIFPHYTQARKALWEGITKKGKPYLSFIPEDKIKHKNSQEMFIELTNGSIWRLIGSDKINNIIGAGPKGVVFSEWSLQHPRVWDYIQPMLLENDGWAIFNGTPRGENHFYEMYMMAKENKNWYTETLTVEDTNIITKEQIEELRKEGKSEQIIQQEYYCSFASAIDGSYYGAEIKKAESESRITAVKYDTSLLVDTWWDLGMNDATAIWFSQTIGNEIRLIDYYENSGEGLSHYAEILVEKNYHYKSHNAPHDIRVRELGTGVARIEIAAKLGIKFNIVNNLPIHDGINAVRSILSRCYFDHNKCQYGLKCLKHYRKKYMHQYSAYSFKPLHDWTSNAADSFRYLAIGHKDIVTKKNRGFIQAKISNI